MEVIESISALKGKYLGSVVSIGNFDGLHIGHQRILSKAQEIAKKHRAKLLAITFDPHPAAVLHPEKAPAVLTPAPLKQKLLERLGVDCWLKLPANREILSLPAKDFIEKNILGPIQPIALVEGEDFHFGVDRAGDMKLLEKIGSEKGFEVVVVSAITIELEQTVRVSSTMIRYMLQSGEVADAAAAAGRPYRLIGRIISGRGKGKELGFPTLNMEKPNQLIPAEGVYAGFVSLADSCNKACFAEDKMASVFSVGQARTFGEEHPLLIEAHLLKSPPSDINAGYMAMDFIGRIRTQHKFASIDELSHQIAKDCGKAKQILDIR